MAYFLVHTDMFQKHLHVSDFGWMSDLCQLFMITTSTFLSPGLYLKQPERKQKY